MTESVFTRLGQSRKFVVLILGLGLASVPLALVATMVFVGRATFDQFVGFSKWLLGAVTGLVGSYNLATGMEDAARLRSSPITAGGDVNLTKTDIVP